jgi:hypothetical protein
LNLKQLSAVHFFTWVFLSCNISFVKPFELLGQTECPDGTAMKLIRRGDEYLILADGAILMSSRMHGSEEALAALACEGMRRLRQPCVLIGGLGMGFTLRAALDLLSPDATVVVAELVSAVVEWNRGALGPLAGHPLKDKRVRVETGDVAGHTPFRPRPIRCRAFGRGQWSGRIFRLEERRAL